MEVPPSGSGGSPLPDGGGGGAAGLMPSVCKPGETLPDLSTLGATYSDEPAAPVTIRLAITDVTALANVHADAPGAEVAVRFSEGDLPEAGSLPNATMRLRGLTVREANQKSYRIKLNGSSALWRGQQVIHLNKHPWDMTRVRQKLSFDVIRGVPEMATLQTRFARLFINDDDKGLYTQVENPDEYFLLTHGLPQGAVYLPVYFDFAPIPEDHWKDLSKLDTVIEAKTAHDLKKLRAMIDAVNDPRVSINEVVRKYFNRKNYVTWLALNVLVGNWDMGASNYLLYSPGGCDGWYFLPWDYDGAWDYYGQPGVPPEQRGRWRAGLTVYWGSALHSRFLRDRANVAEVEAMMTTLGSTAITDAKVSALLTAYKEQVAPVVTAPPDVWYLPTPTVANEPEARMAWQVEYERIRPVVSYYKAEYQRVRERPTPVWMNRVDEGAQLYFEWGQSFDFQGDAVTYDFELARQPTFLAEDLLTQTRGLVVPAGEVVGSVRIPKPSAGQYFWRVVARDAKDPQENWQTPFVDHDKLTITATGAIQP